MSFIPAGFEVTAHPAFFRPFFDDEDDVDDDVASRNADDVMRGGGNASDSRPLSTTRPPPAPCLRVQLREVNRGGVRCRGEQQEEVEQTEDKQGKKKEKKKKVAANIVPEDVTSSCPICLSALTLPVVLVECLHVYCYQCILTWFKHTLALSSSRQEEGGEYVYPFRCPLCKSHTRYMLCVAEEGLRHNGDDGNDDNDDDLSRRDRRYRRGQRSPRDGRDEMVEEDEDVKDSDRNVRHSHHSHCNRHHHCNSDNHHSSRKRRYPYTTSSLSSSWSPSAQYWSCGKTVRAYADADVDEVRDSMTQASSFKLFAVQASAVGDAEGASSSLLLLKRDERKSKDGSRRKKRRSSGGGGETAGGGGADSTCAYDDGAEGDYTDEDFAVNPPPDPHSVQAALVMQRAIIAALRKEAIDEHVKEAEKMMKEGARTHKKSSCSSNGDTKRLTTYASSRSKCRTDGEDYSYRSGRESEEGREAHSGGGGRRRRHFDSPGCDDDDDDRRRDNGSSVFSQVAADTTYPPSSSSLTSTSSTTTLPGDVYSSVIQEMMEAMEAQREGNATFALTEVQILTEMIAKEKAKLSLLSWRRKREEQQQQQQQQQQQEQQEEEKEEQRRKTWLD